MAKLTEKDWNKWHWRFILLLFVFTFLESAVDPVFRYGVLMSALFPLANAFRIIIRDYKISKRSKDKFQ